MQRLLPDRVEEVEEADVVGTGVRAVAGADAAVVDLRVQAVFGVMARVGRADRLAGRGVALLAHDRPELHRHVGKLAFEVALDANPVHGAPARRLELADGRNVVLGVTGRHARSAAGAAVEIDRHAPSMGHYRVSPSCGFSRSSPRAENMISVPSGIAGPRHLHARGRPRQRAGLGMRDAAENADRVLAAARRVTGEVRVPLTDRHRDDVGREPGLMNAGALSDADARRHLDDVAEPRCRALGRLRVEFDPAAPHRRGHRIGQLLQPRQVRQRASRNAADAYGRNWNGYWPRRRRTLAARTARGRLRLRGAAARLRPSAARPTSRSASVPRSRPLRRSGASAAFSISS